MVTQLHRRKHHGTYTPLILSPALWLDASDASTLTLSGSDCSEWRDKSGNARHYSAAGTARPTSTTLNSLGALAFNGTTNAMGTNAAGLAMTNNVGYVGLWAACRRANTNWVYYASIAGANSTRFLCGFQSNVTTANGRRIDGGSSQTLNGATAVSTVNTVVCGFILKYSTSDAYVRLNGAQDGVTTAFQTDGNTASTNSNTAKVGSFDGSQFFSGEIGEIVAVTSEPTADQITALETYLIDKWT